MYLGASKRWNDRKVNEIVGESCTKEEYDG